MDRVELTDQEVARIRPYALRIMAAEREARTNRIVIQAIIETICGRVGLDPSTVTLTPDLKALEAKTTSVE